MSSSRAGIAGCGRQWASRVASISNASIRDFSTSLIVRHRVADHWAGAFWQAWLR
jgi:hypothetical protein